MDRTGERAYKGMRKTKISDVQMRSSSGIVKMATEATWSPRSTAFVRKHYRLSAIILVSFFGLVYVSLILAAMFDGCFAEGHALNST